MASLSYDRYMGLNGDVVFSFCTELMFYVDPSMNSLYFAVFVGMEVSLLI